MAKQMAHVHLTHFEMEIKRHLMCVCGDRMKGKYPYFLSVHSLAVYLSLAPSLDTHHLVFVVREQTHTHTHSIEHRQISQKTHEIIFSGTRTISTKLQYTD